MADARQSLAGSLNPAYWESDSTLTKKGKKVFDEEKKAVNDLEKVISGSGPAASAAQAATDAMIAADRVLAQEAINQAVAGGGDQKEIDKANEEMGKAQAELDKGKPDKAIDHFKKAWEHGLKALKKAVDDDDS